MSKPFAEFSQFRVTDNLHSHPLVFRSKTVPDNIRNLDDKRCKLPQAFDQKREAYVFQMTRPFNQNIVNVQDPCTFLSDGNNLNIILLASDLECDLRSSTNASFCSLYANSGLTGQDVQDEIKTLPHALESEAECPASDTAQKQDPTPELPISIADLFNHDEIGTLMRLMARKEAERIRANRVRKAKRKVVEVALSDACHVGFELAYYGLNNVLFNFLGRLLMEPN